MIKGRLVIVIFALVGLVVGAGLAAFAAPKSSQYQIAAHVALVPAPDLTTVEASNFWEVLTRGQMTRTAAILYQDGRWLPSAAKVAKEPQSSLTLTAAALPETTMLNITMTANSAASAEAALNDVLTNATPEVSALVQPYFVKVIWPPKGGAWPLPAPGGTQLAAGGGLGGFLLGGALGFFFSRWRSRREDTQQADGFPVEAGPERRFTEAGQRQDAVPQNPEDATVPR